MKDMSMVIAKKRNSNNLLTGKILPTLFIMAIPLFFNYLLELTYTIYDTFILSATGIGNAGSVVLFSQIQGLLSATGTGFISGAVILINSYLGRGDKTKARMVITQLLYILMFFSILCVCIFIGLGKPFLRLLQTPENIIDSSYGYYIALVISLLIGRINTLYSSVLTAKGNTKRVLINNSIVIISKLILSSVVVFSGIFKNVNSTYLAICTIIAQLTMFIPAIISFISKKNDLSIVIEKPHKKMLTKIFKLSLPIILGGVIFNLTKVIINSMVVNAYGDFVLTFYGLEGLFFGIVTKLILSFQNASATMIGQAMGNNNLDRVISIYKKTLLLGLIFGIINLILFYIFKEPLSLIAVNNDTTMAKMLVTFMIFYSLNSFASPILEIIIAYLNSLRLTKPKLISDALRTIVLRLPLLAILIYSTSVGYISLAIVYSVSNFMTLIIMLVISIIITKKLKKKVVTQSKLLLPITKDINY